MPTQIAQPADHLSTPRPHRDLTNLEALANKDLIGEIGLQPPVIFCLFDGLLSPAAEDDEALGGAACALARDGALGAEELEEEGALYGHGTP